MDGVTDFRRMEYLYERTTRLTKALTILDVNCEVAIEHLKNINGKDALIEIQVVLEKLSDALKRAREEERRGYDQRR